MRFIQIGLLFFGVLAACETDSSVPSCKVVCSTDADCPSGQACGELGMCTAGEACPCTAGEFLGCDGSTARRCNAAGSGIAAEECAYGCNDAASSCNVCAPMADACSADGAAVEHCSADGQSMVAESCSLGCVDGATAGPDHCGHLEPVYLPGICNAPASGADRVYDGSLTIDTSLDASCDSIVTQTGGADICVIRAPSITIGGTVKVRGNRLVAFVADDAVAVHGTLDASADGSINGPGGIAISGTAVSGSIGGGGAGFRTAGGAGGSPDAMGGGGAAGTQIDYSIRQMFGGTHPAAPTGLGAQLVSRGGGGGGGVMLVACRGDVVVDGWIDVTGGGGQAGRDTNTTSLGVTNICAGAGGGSGGHLALVGANVRVTSAVISANGGGGGGGCSGDNCVGTPGQDGQLTRSSAVGGIGYNAGGRGGDGGASLTPGLGGASTVSPGGGGGSTGYLQAFVPVTGHYAESSSLVSPGFAWTRTVEIR